MTPVSHLQANNPDDNLLSRSGCDVVGRVFGCRVCFVWVACWLGDTLVMVRDHVWFDRAGIVLSTENRGVWKVGRLQALASGFSPVLGGSIVRTGQNSDRKVWVMGWWWQLGQGCSGQNGTKASPDPQKSHFEPIFTIWRGLCPVLVVSPRRSVVDRWARVPGRPGGSAFIPYFPSSGVPILLGRREIRIGRYGCRGGGVSSGGWLPAGVGQSPL